MAIFLKGRSFLRNVHILNGTTTAGGNPGGGGFPGGAGSGDQQSSGGYLLRVGTRQLTNDTELNSIYPDGTKIAMAQFTGEFAGVYFDSGEIEPGFTIGAMSSYYASVSADFYAVDLVQSRANQVVVDPGVLRLRSIDGEHYDIIRIEPDGTAYHADLLFDENAVERVTEIPMVDIDAPSNTGPYENYRGTRVINRSDPLSMYIPPQVEYIIVSLSNPFDQYPIQYTGGTVGGLIDIMNGWLGSRGSFALDPGVESGVFTAQFNGGILGDIYWSTDYPHYVTRMNAFDLPPG